MTTDQLKASTTTKVPTKPKTLWIKRPKLTTPLTKELIDHETLPNCFTKNESGRLDHEALNLLLDIKANMYNKFHPHFLPQFEVDLNHVDLITALNEEIIDTELIYEMLVKLEKQSTNFDSIKEEVIKINKAVLNPLYLKIKDLNDNKTRSNKNELKYLRRVFKAKEGICTELINILNVVKGLDEVIRECIEYKDSIEMINK